MLPRPAKKPTAVVVVSVGDRKKRKAKTDALRAYLDAKR
jgi:hypothetical protein